MTSDRDPGVNDAAAFSWDDYHQALREANAVRSQFFRDTFVSVGGYFRALLCNQVKKFNISACPLCCQGGSL